MARGMSGINISDEIKQIHRKLQLQPSKKDKLYFAVLQFVGTVKEKKLAVQFTSDDVPLNDKGEKQIPYHDQLIGGLPQTEARYILADLEVKTNNNVNKRQVLLISWAPQVSSVRERMICASTYEALKTALGITKYTLQADCCNEANTKAIVDRFDTYLEVDETHSAQVPDQVIVDLYAMVPSKNEASQE